MFRDNEDTYIYNNKTGDIYVRYRKGGNNYEDAFVKMPSGVIPQDSKPKPATKTPSDSKTLQNDVLERLQVLQNDALDSLMDEGR